MALIKLLSKTALAASLAAALVFTFSCSSDDEPGNSSSSSGDSPSSSSSNIVQNGSFGGGKSNDIANYRTVKIGDQVWMAENLNYAVEGSKCYENSEANCDKYGRLYDWSTAMALPSSCNRSYCASQINSPHRGICPSGWHIPSN